MTQTSECDRILPVLTAPEVLTEKLVGHKYFVELVSKQTEIQDSRPVPVSTQTVDVVVTQPTKEKLAQLIAACNWLKDYSIVSYSESSFNEAPF